MTTTDNRCPACNGRGIIYWHPTWDNGYHTCAACKGRGTVSASIKEKPGEPEAHPVTGYQQGTGIETQPEGEGSRESLPSAKAGNGAGSRTRTGMGLPPRDFKSHASTISPRPRDAEVNAGDAGCNGEPGETPRHPAQRPEPQCCQSGRINSIADQGTLSSPLLLLKKEHKGGKDFSENMAPDAIVQAESESRQRFLRTRPNQEEGG